MAFFHRRSKGKDDADAEPKRAESQESSSPPPGRDGPSASEKPGGAGGVPLPSSLPPPHPQRSPGLAPSGPGAQKFTTCFVCGSPLNAGACPQCKMTWVE